MFIRKYGGNIPERIMMNADDVHVGNYVVYINEEGLACFDVEGQRLINARILEDLYIKGLLIMDDGVFYAPVSMTRDELGTEVAFIKYDAETEAMVRTVISGADFIVPLTPILVTLSIGDNELIPEFLPTEFDYAMTTENASDIMLLQTIPEDSEAIVELNGEIITGYDDLGIIWQPGENVLTITLGNEEPPVIYTITVTAPEASVTPPVTPPALGTLSVGGKTLTPAFDPATFNYAMTTEETSDILTLTAVPSDVEVVVTLGGVAVSDYGEGIIWQPGENVLTITLGNEEPPVIYTITVTAPS